MRVPEATDLRSGRKRSGSRKFQVPQARSRRADPISKGGADGGAVEAALLDFRRKSRARLASPQPRPTSPVNWGRGITGCRDDAQAPGLVPALRIFFPRPGYFLTHA